MGTKYLISILIVIVMITGIGIIIAHGDFTETQQIIDSEISCDELTNEHLEKIGDYYMEQMHPGEAHEIMDEMMGGEGSESLKQMHIQMAKRIYCDENVGGMMGGGMMSMMMGNNMLGSGGMMNMMGGGMMGNSYYQNPKTNSFYQYSFLGFQIFFYIILILIIIILVLVIILLINKSKNSLKQKRGNIRR